MKKEVVRYFVEIVNPKGDVIRSRHVHSSEYMANIEKDAIDAWCPEIGTTFVKSEKVVANKKPIRKTAKKKSAKARA